MNPSDHSQETVEHLAEEFLELRRRGLAPAVTAFCARYPAHAEELRAILEAMFLVEDLKSDSIRAAADNARDQSATKLDKVSGYRIIRELGRGGMGVVYEAEQEALGRRVALKLLPDAQARDCKARLRFEREARAAARMHHSNIVPVFDVGKDADRLYYVMQLIHGQGLDEVIHAVKHVRGQSGIVLRSTERSIAASLLNGRFQAETLVGDPGATEHNSGSTSAHAVLPGQSEISALHGNHRAYHQSVAQVGLQAASALAYAHARGVVHRDIKPSNLLLDATGVVWITDFGLAKAGDSEVTQTGDIVGTLRYMPPERFKGLCDVRADIYGLGLTLYEMLVLEPAYHSPDRLKLIEEIRTSEPSSPRTVDTRIPRDLETIVLKAIDKDPRKRYQSADEMGEDLRRFIAGEPVKARRIGRFERMGRWVVRNQGMAGLLAGILVVLAAGTASSSWQAYRARNAEAAAHRSELAALELARAERNTRKKVEEQKRQMKAVLDFVEQQIFAAARPEGQLGGLGKDVTLQKAIESSLPKLAENFKDDPLIEARLRMTIGNTFWFLGEAGIACVQLERARELYSAQLGIDHPDTLKSAMNLAISYRTLGRYKEALELNEETLKLQRIKLGLDHPDTLRSMNNLAINHADLGRQKEALQLREETLRLSRARLGPEDRATLRSMHNLAISYAALGRQQEALQLREATLKLRRAKLGPGHPDTLNSMNDLAVSYRELGRRQEALELIEQTFKRLRAELGPNHPDTLKSMMNLAAGYADAGRQQEALELREETLKLQRAKLGPDNRDTLVYMIQLAAGYADAGRQKEALELREETLKLQRAKLGPDDPDTLLSMIHLAASYADVGRQKEALELREEALKLMPARFGPDHPVLLRSMNDLAKSYCCAGRYAEARLLSQRNLESLRRRLPAEISSSDWKHLSERGELYARGGHWQKAAADYAAAINAHPEEHWFWTVEAPLWLRSGNREAYRRHCREMLRRFGGTDDPILAERTAKALLLAPEPGQDLKPSLRLAEIAVTGTRNHHFYNYFVLTRGLAHHRAGEFERAIDRLNPCLGVDEWAISIPAHFIQAMAYQRLGRVEEASEALRKAHDLVDGSKFPRAEGGDLGGRWPDWLICEQLRQEAEALLGPQR